MDTSKLTSEERQAIAQLASSPGWFIIMYKQLIPYMQSATAQIDRWGVDERRADVMRGAKEAYKTLIETLYKVAELPNPFERHAQALLADLQIYAGEKETVDADNAFLTNLRNDQCKRDGCGHVLEDHTRKIESGLSVDACTICRCGSFTALTEYRRRVNFHV